MNEGAQCLLEMKERGEGQHKGAQTTKPSFSLFDLEEASDQRKKKGGFGLFFSSTITLKSNTGGTR